jgi:hypothetical protein
MAETDNPQATAAGRSWPALLPGEVLCWEGRPAPRCYTFRQWRHAAFGGVLTLFCAIWLWMGLDQAAATGWTWLVVLPLPFLAYALWLAGGQLLAARLEWNNVAYAITDRRLLLRGGLLRTRETALPLARLTWFRMQPHGEELGSLRVHGEAGDPVLFLYCIEYPRRPVELLETAIKNNKHA